jgi:hypothetical protein
MSPLIQDIVLVAEDHRRGDGLDPVQAILEYVDGLTNRYLRLDELPAKAVQAYFAECYLAQVLNGNIHQFVWNSRWDPMTIDNVAAALEILNLPTQAALFSKVREFVDADRDRLQAFLDGQYGSPETRPYMDELSRIGGDFFDCFVAHPDGYDAGCNQIGTANEKWISSWSDAIWVSGDVFEQKLDELAAQIPDLEARKLEAEENRPWPYKRIDDLIAQAGHTLVRLTAIDQDASAAGMTGDVWHMITDRGHHRVLFTNGEAIMLPGEGDDIIARVPVPETIPTDEA